jgi:prepilin-type N-terminal cleavage/methylation domain-containing protein
MHLYPGCAGEVLHVKLTVIAGHEGTMQRRPGFTLIELLIVVVIIGILASIAIPKFANSKQKAYVATLKSDLRNLATAEEAYFYDNSTYTTSLGTTQFLSSQGVTYSISAATATGWAATATHVGLVGATPSGCHIAVGTSQTTASESEGAPYCP